jgi:glycosyltransferase involved in cell wall biosynthesis
LHADDLSSPECSTFEEAEIGAMDDSIRISVVIPAYNASAFLRETLDSLLRQTSPALEIIVVDDGSTDRTGDICREYGDSVRYILQNNQGPSIARNTGILAATGDWVALMDADDIAMPTRLQRTAESITSNPKAVVHYTGFEMWYPDDSRRSMPAFPAKKLWPALRYRTPILPSTATVSREAVIDIGLFRKVTIEEWDLWFRLMSKYGRDGFQDIPEDLILYRKWEGSVSTQYLRTSQGMLNLMDDLLLSGLSPVGKHLWRRRIESRVHHELSIELRSIQDPSHLHHALHSLRRWPLFGAVVPLRRYKITVNMIYKNLRSRMLNRSTSM